MIANRSSKFKCAGILVTMASTCVLTLVSLAKAEEIDFGASNVREVQNNSYTVWNDISFTDDFGQSANIRLSIANGGFPFGAIDSRDSNTLAVTDAKYTVQRLDAPNDSTIQFTTETLNNHSYSNWDALAQVSFRDDNGDLVGIDGLVIRAAHVKATDWINWKVGWTLGVGDAYLVGNTATDSFGNQQRLWDAETNTAMTDGIYEKNQEFRFDNNATPDQKDDNGLDTHRDVYITLPNGITAVNIQQIVHDMGTTTRSWGAEGLRLDFSNARLSSTPEPSSFIFFTIGCAGFAIRTRRHR